MTEFHAAGWKASLRTRGWKRGILLKRHYFTVIGSSNLKMVADKHRHAAYITSTGDELLRNVNIDDLEWPWTPKIGVFCEFLRFGLRHTFQEWIAPKWLEINKDNLHTIFIALNVDCTNPSLDPLGSRRPEHAGVKKGTFLKSGYLFVVGLSIVKMVADRHRHAA